MLLNSGVLYTILYMCACVMQVERISIYSTLQYYMQGEITWQKFEADRCRHFAYMMDDELVDCIVYLGSRLVV